MALVIKNLPVACWHYFGLFSFVLIFIIVDVW